MLNRGAVSWCSCKQSVVAGSTCEAEYMAASEAAHEAIWVKEFITDLGVIPNASGPITLFVGERSNFKVFLRTCKIMVMT